MPINDMIKLKWLKYSYLCIYSIGAQIIDWISKQTPQQNEKLNNNAQENIQHSVAFRR